MASLDPTTQPPSDPSGSNQTVPRPVPASQATDPRTYQLNQLRKRFATAPRYRFKEADDPSLPGTVVSFRLPPSDPDFAFDLDFLEVDLRVPAAYPPLDDGKGGNGGGGGGGGGDGWPTIKTGAPNMPRGFCVNVERGWGGLVREASEKGAGLNLLWLVNALDRNLERFLAEKQAETVTLVTFKDTRHLEKNPTAKSSGSTFPSASSPSHSDSDPESLPPAPVALPHTPRESFTREQIQAARAQRATETKQVESRMSRLVGYMRSSDGIIYTLPLQPRRRDQLPDGLRGVLFVNVIVPLLYPLQKLGVQLSGNGVDGQLAEDVEAVFEQKVAQMKTKTSEGLTIMAWVNYLAQNLHRLAKEAVDVADAARKEKELLAHAHKEFRQEKGKSAQADKSVHDTDKSHVQVIARPPEWVWVSNGESESESDDDDDDHDDWGSEEDDDNVENTTNEAFKHRPALPAEHASTISFPSISLLGIDLLELTLLGVRVRCDRCKTPADFPELQDLRQKTDSCRKCTKTFAATWRKDLVHAGSPCAGTIELVGCTVSDVLTSTFVPQCSGCDSPAGDFTTVPGDKVTNVCRSCHARISLVLPLPRFLVTSPLSAQAVVLAGPVSSSSSHNPTPAAAAEHNLKGGSALPQNGVCVHYRRSFRWFRFSCCARVHPCDRCHDAAEHDHAGERAERMVCGWCSREQRFDADACRFCGRGVAGRSGGKPGFWEGGRGTRSKRLMSRNEAKKWKHAGTGAVAAEAARKRRGEF